MTDPNPRLQTIRTALDDVGSASEAARLQLHLLSMQARERTGGIAGNIEALEEQLDRGLEQAMGTAATKTRQLSSVVRDWLGRAPDPSDGQLNARAIMTDCACRCSPEHSLNDAARLMWEHDSRAVPVVVASGQLIGIITDRDVCMAAYTRGLPLADIFVRDVVSRHVHTCRPEDSLARVATLMAEAQVRRLPVTDAEHRLIGIISIEDVARSAAVLGEREGAELTLQLVRALSQRPHAGPDGQAPAAE
jgi:CBS-domain-containing membrane protein